MDGLMFDTENLTYILQKKIFDCRGVKGYDLDWYKRTIGKRTADIVGLFKSLCGEDFDYDAFRAECRAEYRAYVEENGVPLKSGLFELLDYFKSNGVRLAVSTSTSTESARFSLEKAGVLGFFDELVCAEDVTHGKPHPEPFSKAAEKLGLSPSECLALEDSLNGIKSAHAAGLVTVMIPDLIPPTDEIRPMCDFILPNLGSVKNIA